MSEPKPLHLRSISRIQPLCNISTGLPYLSTCYHLVPRLPQSTPDWSPASQWALWILTQEPKSAPATPLLKAPLNFILSMMRSSYHDLQGPRWSEPWLLLWLIPPTFPLVITFQPHWVPCTGKAKAAHMFAGPLTRNMLPPEKWCSALSDQMPSFKTNICSPNENHRSWVIGPIKYL